MSATSHQMPGLCPSHTTSFPLSSSHHRLLACHRHIAHLLLLLLHEHYADEWYIKRCFSSSPIGCTAFSPVGRSLCSPTTPLRHPSPSGPPPTSQSSHRRCMSTLSSLVLPASLSAVPAVRSLLPLTVSPAASLPIELSTTPVTASLLLSGCEVLTVTSRPC